MKDLKSLIRLNRWQLDEKRRALGELQTLVDRLNGEIERLDAEIEREKASVATAADPVAGFAVWLHAARGRRERLVQSVAQVEAQIAAARDQIAEAFQELKKYELAQEDRDRRALLRHRRRETAAFDEIALNGFRRRQAAEAGE